jgi:hypothetical protein
VKLRRKTRETHRHERAVVLQELGDRAAETNPVLDWKQRRVIERARMDAASRKLR